MAWVLNVQPEKSNWLPIFMLRGNSAKHSFHGATSTLKCIGTVTESLWDRTGMQNAVGK
ncbi:uncharacterized protein ATNIH1004_001953 [Aspergillus tanneri]|uniref:Uncharacterized protein n=1 Tax=Aspergillus tanneri TaxID=1220188 RepID=A0A5M9M410_9EURO|nr:uncharacterized protein ATNIH1004_001953 [Aspergillus tanneri]KAA8641488.1 hypothetical protein ATNIH1004_001953 [Aspergillus tanneri]